MNKTTTYYQPELNYGETPDELYSFMAFATKDECVDWCDNHGYDDDEYTIVEYHNDDIEGVTIINCDDEIIETNEGGEWSKVIGWCENPDNDAQTELRNLLDIMEKHLTDEEYRSLFKKLYAGMNKEGIYL